ncbi:Pyridoxal-5'-phosphate-dependent protein beta subunit [Stackebrandtia nassauensis DSM 44728]|uniref:Pyridoxal-5'-phosphate-dependent protein beta subunit n=2 Tax=Stackebrandtia TaxID=283810 RepID=D3Q7L7_STANL|nr:PLP-dependent cysteine synthase family protein [Stackebrandtia nassauensis]ADD44359.1 Pyridoxal-5'-phosphate-dependent protein beta subunit [Stackebrandtia nassauensis DSM 44728]
MSITEFAVPGGLRTATPGDMTALVGNTPLLRLATAETGHGYWAKLEGANPGGIKDRAALHLVRRARERGDLAPGAPIVESSSGTLGLGLALAGMASGHPVTVVADPGLEPSLRRLLAAYGAHVDIVAEPDPVGGWQEARRARVAELIAGSPGAWNPDQYHNPDNVDAYEALGLELAFQLRHIDILVCAVGTGGHSAGVFGVLRRLYPHARLVGVDSPGSTIFGQPARPRLMRGLGSSIYPRNVAYDQFSEVHWVPPAAAIHSCRRLARHSYATGGWSVGAVALVADWLARREPASARVVAIFPDGPHRYADTVFNDEYCRQHQLLDQPLPTDPETVDNPLGHLSVAWTRTTNVQDPLASQARGDGARVAGLVADGAAAPSLADGEVRA